MKTTPTLADSNPRSRAGVRRTVWILVACALGSYALFLLSVFK